MNEAELWAYLADHPRSYEANMQLGSILLHTDRVRAAIPCGVIAREVGWDHRDPWMLLGQCYVQPSVDRPQDAEPCLRKALAMKRDAMVLQDLAVCMRLLGRMDEARELFREAIELAPDNTWALEEWARLELDLRNPQAALDVFLFSFWLYETSRPGAEGYVSEFDRVVQPLSNGCSYQNYPNRQIEDFGKAYFGGNLPRLLKVKQAYDPGNFFTFPQGLAEAAKANDGNGAAGGG